MGGRRRRGHAQDCARVIVIPFAVAVVVGSLTAGCQQSVTRSCISWADLADEGGMTAAADLVVDAAVRERVGERQMFGIQAAVWQIEVLSVVKGDVEAGALLEVASTPPTCAGQTYPDGDPLDTREPLRLFLRETDFADPATDAGLALITPFHGVGAVGAPA